MRARRLPPVRAVKLGLPLFSAALVAVAACDNGDDIASMEGEPLPWLAVLADEALAKWQQLEQVPDRPVVNVATATGLEHHMGALSMVHGAVDRDTRPRYVLRQREKWWISHYMAETGRTSLPVVPVDDPPPIEGARLETLMIRGPATLALDRVEVDTETRKVAVLTVWGTTVPYIRCLGSRPENRCKIRRLYTTPPNTSVMQYRVEGVRDGPQWVAEVKEFGHPLPEFRPSPPGLHIPDFIFPKDIKGAVQ